MNEFQKWQALIEYIESLSDDKYRVGMNKDMEIGYLSSILLIRDKVKELNPEQFPKILTN